MFTQREIRIGDSYYHLCAAFNRASTLWDAYILKDGEWFAHVGRERCADGAIKACLDFLKGAKVGNIAS